MIPHRSYSNINPYKSYFSLPCGCGLSLLTIFSHFFYGLLKMPWILNVMVTFMVSFHGAITYVIAVNRCGTKTIINTCLISNYSQTPISLFLHKSLCCGCQLNPFGDFILMSTHNIGFYEEMANIIFQLSSNKHFVLLHTVCRGTV